MPHPDLTDCIGNIKRDIESGNYSSLSAQLTEIHRRLTKKFSIPNPTIRQNIANIQSNIQNPNPQNILQIISQTQFTRLLKRSIDCTFHTEQKTNDIFCPQLNDFVDSIRKPNRLIIENTYIALSNTNSINKSIQSWARPKSKSAEYNRHLQTSRNRNKSKFSVSLNTIKKIELILFNEGYGRFDSQSRVFFYGRFSENIGCLADLRTYVPYVRLQCDRVNRPTGTGTCVEIHAYPISPEEIQCDFFGTPIASTALEIIDERLFTIPIA